MNHMQKYILTEEYLQDVLVRLAHHSSAIEGNTISLPDTASIILHHTIPGKTTRREYFEIENHRDAFKYVMENVTSETKLSLSVIKDIHEKLTDRLLIDKGQFKQSDNTIKGADFKTASPYDTPYLMMQWVDNLHYQLDSATTQEALIRIITDFHIQFERIHPFSDGNGRTGRMLMNYSLLEKNLPPIVIRGEDRAEYINILANEYIDKFTAFATKRIQEEGKRIENFMNMDAKKVIYPENDDGIE